MASASKQLQMQDQLLDEPDEPDCPLCIETLDLSDRGFRPCPCGYQICQFCYNNIKTTMNGLCPACRRMYEEKNIRFDAPSAEETARYKENKNQIEKKRAAAKRQEAASRQADNLSRKHLAGIRVRRQNLVYVTGLRLNTSDPQLSEKLRSDQYFGQYGEIDKIVVNKPKDSRAMQPVGVYITFFDKEAAALCIETLDGTTNAGVPVRADYGTTKYCSAFLRHETCSNKNCTFLHEVGEDKESFTREGLSSFNASGTQSSTSQASAPPSQVSHPSLASMVQIPPTTTQTERPKSRNEATSVVDAVDRPALPSHASWAHKTALSRRPSQAQSLSSGSPIIASVVSQSRLIEDARPDSRQSLPDDTSARISSSAESQPSHESIPSPLPLGDPDVLAMKRLLANQDMNFVLDESLMSEEDLNIIKNLPLLFDRDGGARRSRARRHDEERMRIEKDQQVASQALASMSLDETAGAGSLQLGGEPEDQRNLYFPRRQAIAIQPPRFSPLSKFARPFSPTSQTHSLTDRTSGQNQQKQRQNQPHNHALNSTSTLLTGSNPSHDQYGQQVHYGTTGHARQTSRFSFANNDVTRPLRSNTNRFLNASNQAQPDQYKSISQLSAQQIFSSGVHGPPPGLRTSGTPPVSGGGMFGQGHGFATSGPGYGVNSTHRNTNDEMMQELFRNRAGSAGSGQTSDGGRREFKFPSCFHHPSPHPNPGLSSAQYEYLHSAGSLDIGPHKHKKKGKKHRQANTPSSGGGAVDLADPSIVRTRTTQVGGTAQGYYGTQSHGKGAFGSIYGNGNGGFGKW